MPCAKSHPSLDIAAVVAIALGLAGCVGGDDAPSFGDRLADESGELQRLGESWNTGQAQIERGRALIEEGEDEVEEGEDLVESGESKISRGERLVRQGKQAKSDAEEAYRLRSDTGS